MCQSVKDSDIKNQVNFGFDEEPYSHDLSDEEAQNEENPLDLSDEENQPDLSELQRRRINSSINSILGYTTAPPDEAIEINELSSIFEETERTFLATLRINGTSPDIISQISDIFERHNQVILSGEEPTIARPDEE